jgi:hypothetical protein
MKIQVTQQDIRNGVSKSYLECPVALAVKRIYPNFSVAITDKAIWIHGQKFMASRSVQRFIKSFDAGLSVMPFGFNLSGRYKSKLIL